MSCGIELKGPVTHDTLELESSRQIMGGTYVVVGTAEAWLNITYNYAITHRFSIMRTCWARME